MPHTRAALEATDAYRLQLLHERTRIVAQVLAAYRLVDLDYLDVSWRRFVAVATAAVTASQRRGVGLTDAYFAAYLRAELERPVTAPSATERGLVGLSRDGRALHDALRVPVATIATALGQHRGREQALRMGGARITRAVSVEAYGVPSDALAELLEAPAPGGDYVILGWRRVCSTNACGACLAAASGALEQVGNRLRVHPHCRCTKEPYVARPGAERYLRQTGQQIFDGKSVKEQDALFLGRGGAEKARLIRSGEISLDDLIQPMPMAAMADGITETPLAALIH